MDYEKKISIINRISTGTIYLDIDGRLFKLEQPSKEQRALSELYYRNILSDYKFDNIISREQTKNVLVVKNIWNDLNEQEYKTVSKHLEDLKLELYNSVFNENKQKMLKKKIASSQKSLEKMLLKKYCLDNNTLEYQAEIARDEFLIALCIKDVHDNPVYTYENYHKNSSDVVLKTFLKFITTNSVSQQEYREIARTEPFRSTWQLGKQDCFGVPACDLSNEQKTLMLYSKMYDNVYEHPERPSDEVIEDDDMLDGWFIAQRRKNEAERKRAEAESILNKKGVDRSKPGETFVVVESEGEAKKIKELNDLNSNMKMQQRLKTVEQVGRIEEQDLPDVKQELRNQAIRQFRDRRK